MMQIALVNLSKYLKQPHYLAIRTGHAGVGNRRPEPLLLYDHVRYHGVPCCSNQSKSKLLRCAIQIDPPGQGGKRIHICSTGAKNKF